MGKPCKVFYGKDTELVPLNHSLNLSVCVRARVCTSTFLVIGSHIFIWKNATYFLMQHNVLEKDGLD